VTSWQQFWKDINPFILTLVYVPDIILCCLDENNIFKIPIHKYWLKSDAARITELSIAVVIGLAFVVGLVVFIVGVAIIQRQVYTVYTTLNKHFNNEISKKVNKYCTSHVYT